jgi:hypothetical protein
MEIKLSETDKRIIKWGVYLLRKKLGESASAKNMHDDLSNCGNLAISEIVKILNETADNINSDYHKDIVKQLCELGLWVGYKDTAYRDVLFYALDRMLQNADEMRKMIKPYLKEPDKWHINVWDESKKFTEKEQNEGKLLKGNVSFAESVHVQRIQKDRIRKIINKR